MPDLERARVEADRAAAHMDWTAVRARAVRYRRGSVEMAAFEVADQQYRHIRRQLEAMWDEQDTK